MARAIRASGGDYVLAVKGNRGPLYRQSVALLAEAPPDAVQADARPSHGRLECRCTTVRQVPQDWPERFGFAGLAAVGRVDLVRHAPRPEPVRSRYFLLSQTLPPEALLRTVRAHWGIENRQHWVLDVVFREDAQRSRKDNAAQNIALLRRLALNILRTDDSTASIRRKIKRAGWDHDYLFQLLSHMQ